MTTKCLNRGKKFRVHLSDVIFIRNILLRSMDEVVGCFLVIGCWMIISFEIISFLFAKILTLKDPFISESCIEIKIELNFYFHTSLWCLKRFYEGLGLHKTF